MDSFSVFLTVIRELLEQSLVEYFCDWAGYRNLHLSVSLRLLLFRFGLTGSSFALVF